MSKRSAGLLAWSMWALTMVSGGLALLLMSMNDPSSVSQGWYLLPFLAFATVGALIASRRPQNPIGWLVCIVGLLFLFGGFAGQYAIYTLVTAPGSLPAGDIMAWLGAGWVSSTGWGLMVTFLLLLFPTGRLPSRRWRSVAWFTAGVLAVLEISGALRSGSPSHEDYPPYTNPFPIELAPDVVDRVWTVVYPLALAMVVASVASVFARFRRAQGEERQQLKWFAYAALLLIIRYGVQVLLALMQVHVNQRLSDMLWALAVTALPIAIGIAVPKYRLYDIDILINRTLVYGLLTATLVLVYFGSVIVLQSLFRTVTGHESQLAIVASTLAIAALFNPLQRRIQAFIDRRFYRRKYDAAQVLAAFSATARDEVDLDKLMAELGHVVEETLQPAQVSLWLREPQREGQR